mmetsp:Transcript_22687/g.71224  ORF Transcript_22687/g.71224 Transcript_22687/m.71224 type:complete len:211 (+) Transcript_22687:394-1026(+)
MALHSPSLHRPRHRSQHRWTWTKSPARGLQGTPSQQQQQQQQQQVQQQVQQHRCRRRWQKHPQPQQHQQRHREPICWARACAGRGPNPRAMGRSCRLETCTFPCIRCRCRRPVRRRAPSRSPGAPSRRRPPCRAASSARTPGPPGFGFSLLSWRPPRGTEPPGAVPPSWRYAFQATSSRLVGSLIRAGNSLRPPCARTTAPCCSRLSTAP